ncbi:MAG TPA: hypothetical protein VNS33_19960 [Bradyrhizobium sp.]|nr:hypothetical protein [Bradyrhizobium sp.]
MSAPTAGEHMRVLTAARLVRARRVTQWTMSGRNEAAISAITRVIFEKV